MRPSGRGRDARPANSLLRAVRSDVLRARAGRDANPYPSFEEWWDSYMNDRDVSLSPMFSERDAFQAGRDAAVNERADLRSLLQTVYWRATADERDKGAFEANKERYARELSELLGDTWLSQAAALLEGTQDG